jgi:two-component system OmpR family sensor kinase
MVEHIRSALVRQRRSQERLRQFAADASHELRTPVANIKGHAELSLRFPARMDPEVRHSLERIESEANRMSRLVDDLLLLARLDAGRPLDLREVDLTLLVLNGVSDARAAAPDHRWVLDVPEEPVLVEGDEHRLQQVVGNLLANERLHTPAGTRVTVELRVEPGWIRLVVEDDGPGIPPDLRPHLFDRFTHGPHSPSTGSGLGLAIAHAIVTAHGGTLTCDSRPGRTELVTSLPR